MEYLQAGARRTTEEIVAAFEAHGARSRQAPTAHTPAPLPAPPSTPTSIGASA
jgi:hypothetical protein